MYLEGKVFTPDVCRDGKSFALEVLIKERLPVMLHLDTDMLNLHESRTYTLNATSSLSSRKTLYGFLEYQHFLNPCLSKNSTVNWTIDILKWGHINCV